MSNAKQSVDAVRRILGRNERWTLIRSKGAAQTQRWTWECGCILDYVAAGDRQTGTRWEGCGSHARLSSDYF